MREKHIYRRYLSMAMTAVMTLQLCAPSEAVWGAAAHKRVKIITEFAELPESVKHIQIPESVEEAELEQYLQFPETLEAYVMDGYLETGSSDDKKATGSNAQTGEDTASATSSDASYTVSVPEAVYEKATGSNTGKPEKATSNNIGESSASDSESDEDDEYFEEEELFADIPVLTDIAVTWEQDEARETEDGSMYYLPVLPTEYVLADGVELPEIQVSVESGIALFAAGDVIDIADVETNANGQIVINADNLQDWDGKILTGSVASTGLYDPAKGIVIEGGERDSDWITVNLTIRDLTIDRKEYMRNGFSAISVEDCATLNLTVEGDNKLYGAYGGAGIGVVGHGTRLCITGNSTGSLYAKGGNGYGGAAGIGSISPGLDLNSSSSSTEQECGVIEIAGGDITAEGGTYSFRGSKISGGAGIGATYGKSSGHITIKGGTVHAIGGCYGAGIGGGSNGSVDIITISGGTVTAEGTGSGSRQPAAIGLGVDTNTDAGKVLSCGTIDIGHANVTAKGNIGYGYVLSGNYPEATVTIWNDVYLTLDGVVNAGGASVKQYELNFSVFDTSFKEGQEIGIKSIELDRDKIQENITAKVETPGHADFTVSFAHTTFEEGGRSFSIAVEEKEYPYEATINFAEDTTKYHGIAGIELYPVDLEFYDNAITENIVPEEITIKQGGTILDADDEYVYVSSGTIEMVGEGVGRMRVFLPANEGETEITVKAAGINGSNEMTRSGLTVGKDGITSVVMCSDFVTLSAEVTQSSSTDVTISVESNALNWDLYVLWSSNGDVTEPEQIVSEEEGRHYSFQKQKGEISKGRLSPNQNCCYYMVAKQGDLFSNIVKVEFTVPHGAKVIWEDGRETDADSFLNAIVTAETIGVNASTIIKALDRSQNWSGQVTLPKSCILDLNGIKISIIETNYSLAFKEGVSAVILDSEGDAEYHNSNDPYSLFSMGNDVSLTIKGGNYYDYKELLRDSGPSGRELRIEGGSFHGTNTINIGDGTVILSGGTFYKGLSINGTYRLGDGYCFHYLSDDAQDIYTTALAGIGNKTIEVVPYPALEGRLNLIIGNGISSAAATGTELKAAFVPKESGTGTYTYTWYRTDGTTETQISQTSETTEASDIYKLTDDDIGKQIYCVVTEKEHSGSIESEKTYPVIGYSIESANVVLADGKWVYDGTAKEPEVTEVTLNGKSLTAGTHYTVSYENNIHAGENTAKVLVTGTGIYEGIAEKTFTIAKKSVTNPTFEGVEKAYLQTGDEIRPNFTLKDGSAVIPEDEYTVTYTNNKIPGTATINVSAKSTGNYNFDSSKTFTIYQESVLGNTEIVYFYKEGNEKVLHINMNGNTFNAVVDEGNRPVDKPLISIETEQGQLTLNHEYLNSLSVGQHSYKIRMWPQGNREATPLEYEFCVTVKKMPLEVDGVRAAGRAYNGSKLLDITEVILKRQIGSGPEITGVSVNTANLQGNLESADAGNYSKITLPELTLTGTEADKYELIQPTDPVMILAGVTITKAPAPALTWPAPETIEAGNELQTSKLTGGSTEYGTFTWKNPSQKAEEGTHTYEVTFTPNAQTEKNYDITELTEMVSLQAVAPASTEHEGEIAAAAPKVAPVAADAPQEVKDIADVLQNTPPAIKGLETAAKDLLQTSESGEVLVKTGGNQTITGTQAKEMLQNEGINTAGKTVKLVVEPYMEVAVKGVSEENGKRIISLEISAKYNVKATTAGTGEAMEESGTGRNTIMIGTGIQYQVDTPVTITIPLPADYPVENLFIRHILHSGKKVYYPVTVTAESGVNMAAFVNKDGFSTFELLSDGRNGSIVYDQEIGTRNYTLEQVGDALPTVNRSGYRFKGWKINGTIYTEFTLELLNLIDAAEGKSVTAEAVLEQISSGSGSGGSGNGNNSSGSGSSGGGSGSSGSAKTSVSQGSWSAVLAAGITKWRFADPAGVYAANTWKQISWNGIISWYHFGADGYMNAGWLLDTDGHWYYFNPVSDGTQGAMVTGWKKIDGIWYYFNPVSDGTRGAMYHGRRTPDGYYVDETGAWDGKER